MTYNHVPVEFGHRPTEQEVFDEAVLHLANQKMKSATQEKNCVYRHKEGYACVVGHFITDEVYHPKMEGRNISYIIRRYNTFPRWMSDYRGLLYSLQGAHDKASGLYDLKRGLLEVASKFDLSGEKVHDITVFVV